MTTEYPIYKYDCIEKHLQEHSYLIPDRRAIIVKDQIITYKELWKMVTGFADYLANDMKIKKGDHVVVKTMQTADFAVAYFATHLTSAVFVPLERSISDEKALEIIEETEAKVYIANAPLKIQNKEIDPVYINIKTVCEISCQNNVDDWIGDFPSLEDSADIMYTTGTTGRAKGVEVTHHVLLATAENYLTGMEWESDNCMAVPGPLNHVNPLRKLYTSILAGTTIVILNGLMSIKGFYDALDKYAVNSLCLPPASLRNLWNLSGEKLAEYENQINFVECSTSPLTESDRIKLRSQLPKSRLYNNYGLSECGAMVMYDFNKYPDQAKGCVGKAMKNSGVIIVDEQRHIIQSNSEHMGIIANRGSINMKGYWKHPELTEKVKQNGYIYTSDIGYFDSDGFLYVIGRTNDTINVGGLKVEPTDVEEAAMFYPNISECICVPVEDEITGHALKLFVSMKSGASFDENDMKIFLKSKLAVYQLPKYYEVIPSIPRNFVGKPDRNAFGNGLLIKEKLK